MNIKSIGAGLASFLLAGVATLSVVTVVTTQEASATTCSGGGGAKTTFLPGFVTGAETRTHATWTYNCSLGGVLSFTKTAASNYYNSFIDLMSLDTGWYSTSLASIPTYAGMTNNGQFQGCNSSDCGHGFYDFQLHNYVYLYASGHGTYIKSCWINHTTGATPGYSLSCGTW